ncbi:alpha/beta hydrolase [Erythrobacter sp. QSSC1-22B]|uniref:alpha/beta hydrolase n=1 Tax=Erythrobacter sp. QSSC1-22B TaxID=1860125 RepID=UPI0009F659E7|nr:alpha/beta hydrolase [Erythrobacter sp. QSSC1-22B]
MVAWTLSGIAALLALAGIGFWIALQVNSVAVLDTVDRVTGGDPGVERVAHVRLGEAPTQTLSLYRARQTAEPAPVLLFVHGGSWDWGDPKDYGFVARSLAPEGFVVALAGYRLGEEGRYPAMLEDTAQAIRWLRDNAARHGGDPERIYLAGHSAGAYNVVQVALEPRWLAAEGVSTAAIRGVVGMAGPYDFFPFDKDSTRAAFGDATDPEATQPINHVRPDAPPMLLLTGTEDTTVKPRNTRALAAALEQAGVPVETRYYDGLDHSDVLVMLASPWRRKPEVRDDILRFLARVEQASVPVQGETR